MSWSVQAYGKAPAVRKAIAEQFTRTTKCHEPEETVRLKAAEMIDATLAAQSESTVVEVSASGSQSFKDWSAQTEPSNTLSISVVPKFTLGRGSLGKGTP